MDQFEKRKNIAESLFDFARGLQISVLPKPVKYLKYANNLNRGFLNRYDVSFWWHRDYSSDIYLYPTKQIFIGLPYLHHNVISAPGWYMMECDTILDGEGHSVLIGMNYSKSEWFVFDCNGNPQENTHTALRMFIHRFSVEYPRMWKELDLPRRNVHSVPITADINGVCGAWSCLMATILVFSIHHPRPEVIVEILFNMSYHRRSVMVEWYMGTVVQFHIDEYIWCDEDENSHHASNPYYVYNDHNAFITYDLFDAFDTVDTSDAGDTGDTGDFDHETVSISNTL